MQEKTLMNVLFNPQPGLMFRGLDMVRNYILSTYMDLPVHRQEQAGSALEPLSHFEWVFNVKWTCRCTWSSG